MGGEGWNAGPEQRVSIARPYRLAVYPVTVKQFEAFARDGYGEERYWTEAGLGDRKASGWSMPEGWGRVFRTPNHPVVGVSWYEAEAFCRWLREAYRPEELGLPGGWRVRLPSEEEWERAARHVDGREYPWGAGGSAEEVAKRCNGADAGLGSTSAVGMYPGGRAECGAEEMAGNVWEWCATAWREDASKQPSENDPEGAALRVLRGGSWLDGANDARCATRYWLRPDLRNWYIGFRVAASPFP